MNAYKIPIETAFFTFPIIAFIFTIPFLLYQYRKYGGIPYIKSLIIYSFILYLINAFFLIILPLPSLEYVKKMTSPKCQLKLFDFIVQIKNNCNLNIVNIKDVFDILKQPTVFTVIFNLLLTVPFGIYLRYFFRKKFLKTTFFTFLLSLFFEITQLTGLYGIYPRPYRLFDVDDLFINTLGGIIGYFLAPIFNLILPSAEEIEKKSYIKGQNVSLLRRLFAFSIDFILLMITSVVVNITLYNSKAKIYSLIISIIIYYLLLPVFISGNTIGERILKIKVVNTTGNINYINVCARHIIFSTLIAFPISWLSIIKLHIPIDVYRRIIVVVLVNQLINILFFLMYKRNNSRVFFYEYITNTRLKSTIDNQINNSEIINENSNKCDYISKNEK